MNDVTKKFEQVDLENKKMNEKIKEMQKQSTKIQKFLVKFKTDNIFNHDLDRQNEGGEVEKISLKDIFIYAGSKSDLQTLEKNIIKQLSDPKK